MGKRSSPTTGRRRIFDAGKEGRSSYGQGKRRMSNLPQKRPTTSSAMKKDPRKAPPDERKKGKKRSTDKKGNAPYVTDKKKPEKNCGQLLLIRPGMRGAA